MSQRPFEIICEIEPPTRPDLKHVRHQIGVLSPVADAFLIPDNHIGRATVSSVAVAHEVEAMGGRSIACLNSRDRNLLGFRRDLLTAAAYGVDQFLFVHGDKPTSGGRTSELDCPVDDRGGTRLRRGSRLRGPPRAGVSAWPRDCDPCPPWKLAADFMFVQVSYSVETLLRWRDANPADIPVFAGVMVLASQAMARRMAAAVPDIEIPRLAGRKGRDRPDGRSRRRLRADPATARQRRLRRRAPRRPSAATARSQPASKHSMNNSNTLGSSSPHLPPQRMPDPAIEPFPGAVSQRPAPDGHAARAPGARRYLTRRAAQPGLTIPQPG